MNTLFRFLVSLTLLQVALAGVLPRDAHRILKPTAKDLNKIFTFDSPYPPPNKGNLQVHDPNIIEDGGHLYLFQGGIHIPMFKATQMSGPWEAIGTVLEKDSIIEKKNNSRPWAPSVAKWNNRFYCFYAISPGGSQDSAIGYATASTLEGNWTDHGALINTGTGPGSRLAPFKNTNAIDPAFKVDEKSGALYLIYGSYWDDIYSVRLESRKDGTLAVKDKDADKSKSKSKSADVVPDATQLSWMPGAWKPQEGAFVSYHKPYYYLWFSQGVCCELLQRGFPLKGEEYSIRVGRSENINGPFVDRNGKKLLEGYSEVVYGSNNGNVFAPGGVGVLPGNKERPDILYHHYFDGKIGFHDKDTQLGWHHLEYKDGWPVLKKQDPPVTVARPMQLTFPGLTYLVEVV
ncbi:putative endo-arabinanase [Aspergillus clavatus NRRL 1]|uniref:Arabinan endo-1,5-alpha-L-arabinosidase n=1 Tax=Aspergillus clavatus (strain ATCC 1007 / CBS 513.65 / DSM 816 / NCTC 3887 / NRRL 1 / QM 1276 / 107) TaxID=344612 RepID=A1CN93_ASPCL|nr:glycosyl hydrolase family 43 protein [Aspergillus clavatus NRRL 1]EAW07114.1 glycosyl hydrolase family 43 protein [Aspergillus clavatus NRRL 1]